MSVIVYLAPVKGAGTTVYGAGHQMTETDENVVRALVRDGKAATVSPEARQIRVSALGTTTATISFTVDQVCSFMRCDYGIGTTNLTQATTPTTGSGAIVANLTGLTTASVYLFKILTESAGSGTTATSPTYTFTTL